MNGRGEKEPDQSAVGNAAKPTRRRGLRLGEHDEREEKERCVDERRLESWEQFAAAYDDRPKRAYHRCAEECEHQVGTAELAYDEHSSDKHEREHRKIPTRPPRRSLLEKKRDHDGTQRRGIEEVFAADCEDIF